MPIYATVEELETYLGDTAPVNAEMLIKRASRLVATATRGAIYTVDDNDLPVDLTLLAALNEATLAQTTAWYLNDIDPRKGVGGANDVAIASKSLGGASVSYQNSQSATDAKVALASGQTLDLEAHRILLEAGLLTTKVQSRFSPLASVVELLS